MNRRRAPAFGDDPPKRTLQGQLNEAGAFGDVGFRVGDHRLERRRDMGERCASSRHDALLGCGAHRVQRIFDELRGPLRSTGVTPPA